MFANNDNEKTIKTYASLLQDIRESHAAQAGMTKSSHDSVADAVKAGIKMSGSAK